MITVGMHTCRKTNGKDYVIKNAPFFAQEVNATTGSKQKLQFLGSGFYFWDNNIEMARIWGKSHCSNDYFILACKIDISQSKCFDLVGSRDCQIYIKELLNKLQTYGFDKHEWNINTCINYLKKLSNLDSRVFPYENIRAIDYLPPEDLELIMVQFVSNTEHYTILNPKITICVLDKQTLPLHSLKLLEES